jgi:hypothetical protein
MEIRKHVNFRGGTQIMPIPARRKSVSIALISIRKSEFPRMENHK